MNNFRLYIYLLVVPITLFVTMACGDDDKDEFDFRVLKTTIETSPYNLEGTIELSSSDFEYTTNGDWCEVIKEGNILKLSAGVNYDFNNRTQEIIISSKNIVRRVPVTQTGVVFEFLDNRIKQFNLGLPGGERIIELMTNIEYEVVIPDENKEWISVESLGKGKHKIIVDQASSIRDGKVGFRFNEKYIEVLISQFNYLTYDQILGPAKMTYTNSEGERVETDIEIVEKESLKSVIVKATFESGIAREIPLEFIDNEEYRGELRFRPTILEEYFTDAENHASIVSLGTVLYSDETHTTQSPRVKLTYPDSAKGYYPGVFKAQTDGNLFIFQHRVGANEGSGGWTRNTRGFAIYGLNKRGSIKYGNQYDTVLDFEILIP